LLKYFVLISLFLIATQLDLPNFYLNTSKVASQVQDHGNIKLYFCPHQGCEAAFVKILQSATKSIDCALFDVGLESVQKILLEKSSQIPVRIVTDNDYLHKFTYPFVKSDSWGLQHNKFCVIDNTIVSTGSMNPTNNGVNKNNNNLLIINSSVLASNYAAEFEEMWTGIYKKGSPVLNPLIKLNQTIIENYFCPDDSCAAKIKDTLKTAETSIHFLTFSFTGDGIANILLLKKQDGLKVQGIMEARQVTKFSTYERLKNNGINVIKDSNPQNMHHKIFIIDEKIVITGSMNPTNGGDKRNDENILIIHDPEIAGKYMNEFNTLFKSEIK
jgi:phosphatidylserine/phosphatidylglycerophosphate/cardiolipin synthase-like enzyme